MNGLKDYDVGEVFSGVKSGKTILGWEHRSPYVPLENPNYVFPAWAADIILWFMHGKEPLYIFGPTGCGKTSCVKQIVQRVNYPVYEVTGHNRLEFPELVGHHTVQQGSMQYVYGPLAMAMKTGGVLLVNEMDLLDPATAAGLNSVLDGYPLSIPENSGELILPHPLFRFVATANSNGGGDHTGFYQGVLRQNLAFMDRFTLAKATYLDKSVEKQILQGNSPELPEGIIGKMLDYAEAVRRLYNGEGVDDIDQTVEVTFSLRTLIRWVYLTVQYEPLRAKGVNVVAHALERALIYRASLPTQQVLRELLQRFF